MLTGKYYSNVYHNVYSDEEREIILNLLNKKYLESSLHQDL